MSFKDIQKDVNDWTKQFKIQYWEPHEILARVTEEVGELAREINALYGPKVKKVGERDIHLGEEMGDIIFTLACLANSKGIDLDEAWQKVMNKCYGRDNDRYEKK